MFSDIANHWASQGILALAQKQVVSGYPNRTFRPKATVARAELVALLPKAFPELTEKQSARSFRDMPIQHWAHEAVSWSDQCGLLDGLLDDNNSTFYPRRAVSRAQAVAVLIRALEATQGVEVAMLDLLELKEVAVVKPEVDTVAQFFSDAEAIAEREKSAIAAALKRKLLEPITEPRPLLPNVAITRGELAALLCRALDIPAAHIPAAGVSAISQPALEASSQSIFQQFLQQEAGFNESQLAFLDRGIQNSPYRADVAKYAQRLQQPQGAVIPPSRQAMAAANTASYPVPYPNQGELFFVDEGGLEFLPADILAGCVCIATTRNGELQGRWLGRDALSDRQLWSATKFIPLLNLAARANAIAPNLSLEQCKIRAAGSAGRHSGYSFQELAAGIMSYSNRVATSNSLAAMFKNFEAPERLEKWAQQMTGNQSLSFQGRYGEVPFIEHPELWSSQTNQVLLKSAEVAHEGENLMSVYDLTRLLSMAAWHWQLPVGARIPKIQTHSLESIVRALAVDTARYVEVALEKLGIAGVVQQPVILSKCGFGRSDQRDRTELTYCALAQFSLPRTVIGQNVGQNIGQNVGQNLPDPTAAYQRYSICFTLVAAQNVGDADEEARYVDALMAIAVTDIIRRLVLGTL
jgi:hypothetical protein